MKTCLGWLAICIFMAGAGAGAAERPQDYAYGNTLDADGREALYEITLPATLYQGIARRDLSDVRVFNATGEVVPYALRPRSTTTSDAPAPVVMALFPLRSRAGAGVDGLAIQVRRGGDGTTQVDVKSSNAQVQPATHTVGYLIDLSNMDRPIRTMDFEWQMPATGFAGRMRVDASDDLSRWRTLVTDAPLVSLTAGGLALQQKRIELPPYSGRYLRLSWNAQDATQAFPDLLSARGEPAAKTMDAPREWASFEASKGEKPGEYLFDLNGLYPVDRMRLGLSEPNTIVQFELLVRDRRDLPWQVVTHGVAYRLRHGDGDIASPDISFGAVSARHWMLRVDQRGGGTGAAMPRLHVGWVPHQLVFAARGAAPFQLAYGNREASPAAYVIETVIPGYRGDAVARVRAASAGAQQVINVNRAQALAQQELGGESRRMEAIDWKRWSLWGGLLLGVVILLAMAWRLARQIRKEGENGGRAP